MPLFSRQRAVKQQPTSPVSPSTTPVVAKPTITIIYARWVATVASDGFGPCPEDIISHGAVAIEHHRIAAVGKAEVVRSSYESSRIPFSEVKLSDSHILIPGLINCHTHMAMSFLRGYSDDQDLNTWLTKYIWPTEKAVMGEDFVRQGTEIAVYEAIKSGTTMLNDSYFFPKTSMKVVEDAGIRCVHGEVLLDFGGGEITTQLEKAKELISEVRETALKKTPKDDYLIRASFNPHAAYTVPQEWVQKGYNFLEFINSKTPSVPVIIHTHLHETKKERQDYEQSHEGKTALEMFDEAGVVNHYFVAAHCVHMTKAEIELMAKRKASVCHCPKSNLKLASGFAPISDMLKKGVNVCLGTDGGCSNNSLDMLSEMQFAALVNKAQAGDPKVLDAYTVLRMATRNGSRAMGRLGDLGSIEVGKLADLVAVHLGGTDNVGHPIFDPISHLVYTTHRQVTDVWVNGKRIMESQKVKTVKIDTSKQETLYHKLIKLREELQIAAKSEELTLSDCK